MLVGRVDPEQMKFFVDAKVDPVREVPFEEILNQLLNHTKQPLIHEDVVKDVAHALSKGEVITERRVAKGFPPKHGVDGKIIYLARRLELKGGKVAPKYIGTPLELENIDLHRHVARVYKPKPGSAGKDVLGKDIPATPGKPAATQWDESLASQPGEEQYDILVAKKSGFLGEEQNKLSVVEELSFDGDFDHRYGSLDFIGAVRVKGDVQTDSYICGRKGVFVGGGVLSGVVVRAPESTIEIKGTVNGGHASKFECGGVFTCSVLQQSEVDCKSDIVILKEAHSAQLRAQGMIVAEQGQLFGVDAYASGNMWVGKLGNHAGVTTSLHLCSAIESQLEFRELVKKIESHDKAEHLLELHIGPVVKNPDRIAHLQPMHRVRVEGLLKKYKEVQKSKAALLVEKEAKLKSADAKDEMAVNVAKTIYPGARITAGMVEWVCLDEMKGPVGIVMLKDAEKFTVGEFRAHAGPENKDSDKKKEKKR